LGGWFGSLRRVATAELKSSPAKCVTFVRALKGDEKGEAPLFLDHFFRVLLQPLVSQLC
jgi:hypothetical protein